jgi:hypothetical protein
MLNRILLCLVSCRAGGAADAQTARTSVPLRPDLKSVCEKARSWAKANEGKERRFAAVTSGQGYNPAQATWKEYPTEAAFLREPVEGSVYYTARVWEAPSGAMFMTTVQNSFSEDWMLYTDYCYLPSGWLSRI